MLRNVIYMIKQRIISIDVIGSYNCHMSNVCMLEAYFGAGEPFHTRCKILNQNNKRSSSGDADPYSDCS